MMMYQLPIDISTRMIRVARATKSPLFHNASRPYGLLTTSWVAGAGGGAEASATDGAAVAAAAAAVVVTGAGVCAIASGAATVAAEIINAMIRADSLRGIDILVLQN